MELKVTKDLYPTISLSISSDTEKPSTESAKIPTSSRSCIVIRLR